MGEGWGEGGDGLRDREDDIIWRVRWGERWLYLYLIIEFQSTVDPFMAVRLLTYVGLLYQDLKRTKRLESDSPLPPVLPIVLYNGFDRWTAATELAEMREPDLPPTLAQFQPQLRYLLLDEGRIAEHPDPHLRNLAAALFRIEFSPTIEDCMGLLAHLFQWLSRPEQADLRRAFATWLNRVGIRRHLPGIELDRVYDLQEIHQMLAERSIDWTAQWKQQGRQEGDTQILRRLLKGGAKGAGRKGPGSSCFSAKTAYNGNSSWPASLSATSSFSLFGRPLGLGCCRFPVIASICS